MKRGLTRLALLGSILTGALACTWVPLDDQASSVTVAEAGSLEACDRVGTTTSSVRARIGFVNRSEIKVKRELVTLARNEAARMDGDTVSPESPVEDGRRVFGVYRCKS